MAMWRVLEKYGFPPLMVSLIRSFHEDMSAELRINGKDVKGEIRVSNGLRQGCTMAPALFNLFFNLVVETWRVLQVHSNVVDSSNGLVSPGI